MPKDEGMELCLSESASGEAEAPAEARMKVAKVMIEALKFMIEIFNSC